LILIEVVIKEIVDAEKAYEEDLSNWEMEQRFKGEPSNDGNDNSKDDSQFNNFLSDYGIKSSDDKEEDTDDDNYTDDELKELSKSSSGNRTIQSLVDAALDSGDYKSVERYSKFLKLKESREIYEKELKRIRETYRIRK